ncbi:MAG: RNA polymerase sigma factor [Candidatus Krumholzibacteriia bacterium]
MGFYWREEERGIVQPTGRPSSEVASRGGISGPDLEIEKKWLQLVRIDQEQFTLFFDKYHDRIFDFIYLKIEDHDTAADLTGEVFTVAWKRINRFTWQGYSFGAWLFQIARGVLKHEFRRRRRNWTIAFDPDEHGPATGRTPEMDMVAGQDAALVRSSLRRLSPERQDIFILHYWMDFTVKQIGMVMRMPEGTVTSHLSRGRKIILDHLLSRDLVEGLSPDAVAAFRRAAGEETGFRVLDGGDGDPGDGD